MVRLKFMTLTACPRREQSKINPSFHFKKLENNKEVTPILYKLFQKIEKE